MLIFKNSTSIAKTKYNKELRKLQPYRKHNNITFQEYLNGIAEDKIESFDKLQHTIKKILPKWFDETMI